ncbi:2-keto-4-pentenoate hydratase [Thalassoroseus pseudoceratinae]|uniref:2-keto-4-pentenoate hydratase n=1 Tax=Thalassoroseus pseudoceratinae TaxID=2713176 RepID=UPI00141FC238|nr:fumarylacetoacetate hydrolase family protein [Thalassoroseus pseudoceratinae]
MKPLSPDELDQAARQLFRGRAHPPRLISHLPPVCRPQLVADAMAIQSRLHELLTEAGRGEVVGTKIGCTTPVMQAYLGMAHPCAGGIFESTVLQHSGEVSFDRFLHVGVECEIAVRIGKSIQPRDHSYGREEIAHHVEAVFAAIEIVDDRYVDFANREPDWRTWVADDFFGAGLVLGPPVTDWQTLDLASVHGEMRINGTSVGDGVGRDIINGHPLEALVWLANSESARQREIPAGWLIALGSVVQTQWVSRGDLVSVHFADLGEAAVRFA